jgi:glutathione S-transferase
MADIVLHHYDISPFAEKIRAVLGYKGLDWRSVNIPRIMPKPDLTALTGGYRRTPVMQIGADVYCDTALIVRVLERVKPAPTLYPYGDTLAIETMARWADGPLFNITVPLAFQGEGMKQFFPNASPADLEDFRNDRAAMRQGGSVRRGPLAECKANFAFLMPRLEAEFADGRAFLFGNSPCAADFAVYHTLWPLRVVPAFAGVLMPYPKVVEWIDRMIGIGHGKVRDMTSAQALGIAKSSRPVEIHDARAYEADGIKLGETVEVMPVDYALDPVRGELLDCSPEEIAVRRSDPRAGTVVVHFPRFGFQLRRPA